MKNFLKIAKNDKGATAIEYGLIAALIAVAALGGLSVIGTNMGDKYESVSNLSATEAE